MKTFQSLSPDPFKTYRAIIQHKQTKETKQVEFVVWFDTVQLMGTRPASIKQMDNTYTILEIHENVPTNKHIHIDQKPY